MGRLGLKKLCVELVCILSIALLESGCGRDGLEPELILEKMKEAYLQTSTYQDSGVVIMTMVSEKRKDSTEQTFLIMFKRPNLLRFESFLIMFGKQQDHVVVWSDGKEIYSYHGYFKEYKRESSLSMAILGESGISRGSSYSVPSMLLGDSMVLGPATLTEPSLLPQEKFEGTQCYVIEGKQSGGSDCKLWIGVADCLLRKWQCTAKIDKALMDDVGSHLREKRTEPDVLLSLFEDEPNIIFEEIHREIKVDKEISDDEFKFEPPKGTTLVEDSKAGQ